MIAIGELAAVHDARKSFYGKAMVRVVRPGVLVLRSYDTDVARIEDGVLTVKGHYSTTTGRLIKEFMRQNGFAADAGLAWRRIVEKFAPVAAAA